MFVKYNFKILLDIPEKRTRTPAARAAGVLVPLCYPLGISLSTAVLS